ncbi:MAG TPA: heme-copper oxidase subunit III [Chloroflexi bacterium]|nr:heme-copper oxidase subunit III [Chloroflexota bacterium]
MIEKNKLGMLLFIASEAVFFILLILAYIYFRGSVTGPTAASSLDIGRTAIFTVFLLSSSPTVWLAERSLKQGEQRRLWVWLLVTVVFGAVFLLGQASEYAHLFAENITMSRNLFGTTFFTLTGFHGFHVLIGLVALAILLGFAVSGEFQESHSAAVETVALYWHFVDVVWIVIFSVVYLWTFL